MMSVVLRVCSFKMWSIMEKNCDYCRHPFAVSHGENISQWLCNVVCSVWRVSAWAWFHCLIAIWNSKKKRKNRKSNIVVIRFFCGFCRGIYSFSQHCDNFAHLSLIVGCWPDFRFIIRSIRIYMNVRSHLKWIECRSLRLTKKSSERERKNVNFHTCDEHWTVQHINFYAVSWFVHNSVFFNHFDASPFWYNCESHNFILPVFFRRYESMTESNLMVKFAKSNIPQKKAFALWRLCDSYAPINETIFFLSLHLFIFVWLVRISLFEPSQSANQRLVWKNGVNGRLVWCEQLHNQEQLPYNQNSNMKKKKEKTEHNLKRLNNVWLRFSLCMFFFLWLLMFRCKFNQMDFFSFNLKFNNGMVVFELFIIGQPMMA